MAYDAKYLKDGGPVEAFMATVDNATRRADAETTLALYREVTGLEPKMWGSAIIGFGDSVFTYPNGRKSPVPAACFSPRKGYMAFYLGRSIARPINRLAAAADAMRRSKSRDVAIPDFTEREDEIGDLSAALNELTNDLWHRLDAIEAFAADVSHELKNPLASMKSAIETVTRIKDPEKQKRLLDMVREDVERLDRLITDISRASRLDSELSRLKLSTVDVGRILGALSDIRNTAAAAAPGRPTVKLVLPGRDKLAARTDEDRLVQVFQNVLVNAESFSPPGGVITVTGAIEGNFVRIAIDDQGPGIPPGKEKDIFRRFYSERPAGEKFGTHSGLGLSISKLIVEAMGGTIHAENLRHPDGSVAGARFVIKLTKAG